MGYFENVCTVLHASRGRILVLATILLIVMHVNTAWVNNISKNTISDLQASSVQARTGQDLPAAILLT